MKRLLVALLVSLVLLAGACRNEVKVEPPRTEPLESSFTAILPTGENLYIDLILRAYRTRESTTYFSDGSILHSRFIGNEDSFTVPDKSKTLEPVSLSMRIYVYQNEEQAIDRIHKLKESRLYEKTGDTEYYAKIYEFPPEKIGGYTSFWREPAIQEVQGHEVIFFRLGQYVSLYEVYMTEPPELSSGYFMPPELHDLLQLAVHKTILNLRSLQSK